MTAKTRRAALLLAVTVGAVGIHAGSRGTFGAEAGPAGSPEEMIQRFFKTFGEDKTEEAFKALVRGSEISETGGPFKNLVAQGKKVPVLYGKLLGVEQISTTKIGEAIVGYEFTARQEKLPIRWRFRFYKAAETWVVTTVDFNGDYDDLFGEAARKK